MRKAEGAGGGGEEEANHASAIAYLGATIIGLSFPLNLTPPANSSAVQLRWAWAELGAGPWDSTVSYAGRPRASDRLGIRSNTLRNSHTRHTNTHKPHYPKEIRTGAPRVQPHASGRIERRYSSHYPPRALAQRAIHLVGGASPSTTSGAS